MKEYKTYKLTYSLSSPTRANYPYLPTFDALLSYGFVMEVFSNRDYRDKYLDKLGVEDIGHSNYINSLPVVPYMWHKLNYTKKESFLFQHMPIKHDNYFFASSMIPNNTSETVEFFRSKFNQRHRNNYYINKAAGVRINAGQDKSIQLQVNAIIANEVSFVFQTDSIDEVMMLIRHIKSIGKKRNLQLGQIERYDLEEIDYDWQVINRPIPERFATAEMIIKTGNVNTFYMTWQPHYKLSQKEKCVINAV